MTVKEVRTKITNRGFKVQMLKCIGRGLKDVKIYMLKWRDTNMITHTEIAGLKELADYFVPAGRDLRGKVNM
ncbi:MAG: hypothetical protein WCW63_02550 [Acholeplasmataceae bacterium]|jgi:sulfur relay (sulfurtransferase) complex TusBCD TusD component (DsrE family)